MPVLNAWMMKSIIDPKLLERLRVGPLAQYFDPYLARLEDEGLPLLHTCDRTARRLSSRRVFLRHRAPARGFADTISISSVVRRTLIRAGVTLHEQELTLFGTRWPLSFCEMGHRCRKSAMYLDIAVQTRQRFMPRSTSWRSAQLPFLARRRSMKRLRHGAEN